MVALKDSTAAGATSLADLADANIGVQIGTTSLDAVNASIQPSSDPQVFDTSNDVVSALKNHQVDAVVVDVPTAFYLTAAQVPEATVVGQFPAPGGDQWGALLEKDSPLTACVSQAIDELKSSGELPKIEQKWMSQATKAPVLSRPARRARRRAERRRRSTRRGQAIAAISTVVVLGGLAALVLTSPGWPDVRDTFFDWSEFKSSFPDVAEGLLARRQGLLHRRGRASSPSASSSPCCGRSRRRRCFRCGSCRSSTPTSSAASRRSCSST